MGADELQVDWGAAVGCDDGEGGRGGCWRGASGAGRGGRCEGGGYGEEGGCELSGGLHACGVADKWLRSAAKD